jgi:hypothetical protein
MIVFHNQLQSSHNSKVSSHGLVETSFSILLSVHCHLQWKHSFFFFFNLVSLKSETYILNSVPGPLGDPDNQIHYGEAYEIRKTDTGWVSPESRHLYENQYVAKEIKLPLSRPRLNVEFLMYSERAKINARNGGFWTNRACNYRQVITLGQK